MKTSERHHLKDNELALALNQAQQVFFENQRNVWLAVGGLLVVIVAIGGWLAYRTRVATAAESGLAAAMVVAESPVTPPPAPTEGTDAPPAAAVQPAGTYTTVQARSEAALPKFLAAADAYPSTDAGLTARYHAASTLLSLSRFDEAIKQYDQVIASGSGITARMARLGKAETQLRSGQYDAAIASFKELSTDTSGVIPQEAALMELARAYRVAGKADDAKKTLNEIIEKHAESPFATEAKQLLDK